MLTSDYSWTWKNTALLVEIYTKLSPSNAACPFEVVFVAVGDVSDQDASYKCFQEIFSTMPWTAVPFSDSETRECLAKSFLPSISGAYVPSSFVISETGVVLQDDALPLFKSFGAAGYPFSDERLECLIAEDEEARRSTSLKALLASPERDYVINNQGDKVYICDLEDKVVALYLYEEGWTSNLTKSLKSAYEHWVRDKKEKFEVVLIYIHDSWATLGRTNAESFRKVFDNMPWLALPFADTNCKKIKRVFQYRFELGGPEREPSLVIIGPRGKYVEPWGAGVLMNFGIEAYPFTREKAYMLQVEKIKKLKLEMLWGPEAVLIQDGVSESTSQEVHLSDINVGKRIIVFSDNVHSEWYMTFKMKLQNRYVERKSRDEFEVIQLGARNGEVVPWLKLHPSFDNKGSAGRKLLCDILDQGYGILVFDHDGKAVIATSLPRFAREEFPFCDGTLEEEVAVDLDNRCDWVLAIWP